MNGTMLQKSYRWDSTTVSILETETKNKGVNETKFLKYLIAAYAVRAGLLVEKAKQSMLQNGTEMILESVGKEIIRDRSSALDLFLTDSQTPPSSTKASGQKRVPRSKTGSKPVVSVPLSHPGKSGGTNSQKT